MSEIGRREVSGRMRRMIVAVLAVSLVGACEGAPLPGRGTQATATLSPPAVTPLPPDLTGWDVHTVVLDPGIKDLVVTPDSGGMLHGVFGRSWKTSTASLYRQSPVHGQAWNATLALRGREPRLATGSNDIYILLTRADACRNGLGVVHNAKRGALAAWSKVTCVTNTEVSAPTIAAAGTSAYIAWIDPDRGDVILETSRDGGRTFERTILGRTEPPVNDDARVSLAADAINVVASWPASTGPIVRWSADAARSWGPPAEVASNAVARLAVRGGRILVEGPMSTEAWVVRLDDSTLGRIPAPWVTDDAARRTQFFLGPSGSLGAFTAPRRLPLRQTDPIEYGVATWRTTNDDGSTWSPPATVPIECQAADTARVISVAWSEDGEIDALVRTDDDLFVAMRP